MVVAEVRWRKVSGALIDIIENGSETEREVSIALVRTLIQNRMKENWYDSSDGAFIAQFGQFDYAENAFMRQLYDIEWRLLSDTETLRQ